MSPITSRRSRIHLTKSHLAFLGLITLSVLLWIITKSSSSLVSQDNKCLVSFGKYSGYSYSKSSETLNNKCLVESRWMRLAQHSVLLPNKDEAVNDWLWIDYHDRINVLVEAPPTRPDAPREKSFMILSQTKYALDDTSLAVVGGIIEPGEEALKAAQREVLEELSVVCENWESLGRFRTDVNRGMGWVSDRRSSLFEQQCVQQCSTQISVHNIYSSGVSISRERLHR